MVKRALSAAPIAAAAGVLAGCYTEGHSYFLGQGESSYFLTLAACEKEAAATYVGGGWVYAGYECNAKLLFFTVETSAFYQGERTR